MSDTPSMNGAQALAETLLAGGIDLCFANPGTSEMHFVAALDANPRIRCVLGLAEGVVTGMADGYARMASRPAATLLHLGPGLANGLANLHNARKARSPVVNVVGDHAGFHAGFETPLASDAEGFARPVSHWVGRAVDAASVSSTAARAISEARGYPGRIATLLLPADAAWSEVPAASRRIHPPPAARAGQTPDARALARAVTALRSGEPTLLFLGSPALRAEALDAAGRLASHCGCKIANALSTARIARGAGRVPVSRLPYPPAPARAMLAGFAHVIAIGTPAPVSFFGYPGQDSVLTAAGCDVIELGDEVDAAAALEALVDAVGARAAPVAAESHRPPELPADAPLSARLANQAIAALLPEDGIVVDEAITSIEGFLEASAGAAPHDMLRTTGGAIGIGPPLAAGAAIAAPGRKVVALQADGSAMYTLQALWTQARESLDVLTVIYANRAYRILEGELRAVGAAAPGQSARRMLSLDGPALDWVSLARGMGVEAVRADTVPGFVDGLRAGLRKRGPFLVEAII